MTVTDIRPRSDAHPEPPPGSSSDTAAARVLALQEMIRSGRYAGYLDELKDELAKAKAARAELVELTATTVLAA